MTNNNSTKSLLTSLWVYIPYRRRYQLYGLLILMILSTITDIISIGAVIPFLQVLMSPEKLIQNQIFRPFLEYISISNPSDLTLLISFFFVFAVLLSGLMRILLLWSQTRLGSVIGIDLSREAYKRSLYQPYIIQISRNSSEITSVLVSKIHIVVTNILIPLTSLCSALILVMSVVSLMFFFEPQITIISISILGGAYILVARIFVTYLRDFGKTVTNGLTIITKQVIESFSAIRDLILGNNINDAVKRFEIEDTKVRQANANIIIIGGIPRPAIETVILIFFAVIAYSISNRPDGMVGAIPLLGGLALAAQRVLPMAHQIYSGWTAIISGIPALKDVMALLNQNMIKYDKISSKSSIEFKKEVSFKDLSFCYRNDDKGVIKKINFKIKHGARLGIIGKTGSGKSTLVDIFMGLLKPTSGSMCVDNVTINKLNVGSWQKRIAHVPQSIYLIDASIAENIAFGQKITDINYVRLHRASKQAQIHETIESWPDKYKTIVGEKGVRLSGGQRQRIGIARALYQESDIIVFDEATNALDTETEASLVNAINNLDDKLTMLIIAHRLSTLKACSEIIKLENGKIVENGTYRELIKINKGM